MVSATHISEEPDEGRVVHRGRVGAEASKERHSVGDVGACAASEPKEGADNAHVFSMLRAHRVLLRGVSSGTLLRAKRDGFIEGGIARALCRVRRTVARNELAGILALRDGDCAG
jgi:hypothetical protein